MVTSNILRKEVNAPNIDLPNNPFRWSSIKLSEITEKKKVKFQEQIEEVHELFKEHVQRYRNSVDISKVATGEYWFGIRAIELNLVDELKTSDDYLLNLSKDFDIYHIFTPKKESFKDKLTNSAQAIINSVILKNIQKEESQYPLLM
jgi:serine protease SohB